MSTQTRKARSRRKKAVVAADAKDPQRKAAYDWEESWYEWGANTLSLRGCRELIYRACIAYRVPPPTVVQHKQKSYSWSMGDRISMQAVGSREGRGGKNPATVLHEAAHWICTYLKIDRQHHGPTWLGIYMWLLENAGCAPAAALAGSARKFGLRWRKDVSPSHLRAARKVRR